MGITKERIFELAIEDWLVTSGGYTKGARTNYDPALALDTAELYSFVNATQSEAWTRLVELQGGDPDETQNKFYERVAKQIDERGTIDVLRHGVEDLGVQIDLAYFRPATGLNPDTERLYDANRLTLTRQLEYRGDQKALDLTLFVNGIPVATAELKNKLSGQSVEHALAQYRTDRDPKDTLLGRRAIVHFAVDSDEVMMTTRLEGPRTRFLPFNRGSHPSERQSGKGNPPTDGYATSYLWERIWERHAWLDILHRFVHVEPKEPGARKKAAWREGDLIFPRYHQWDAVRQIEAASGSEGAGHNYLVMHSAGSGKSNTIAWLAHRLASLHDEADTKVFTKVVVITDRKVLDKQLQDTIGQFEHAHGVVAMIEESSKQLAEALRSAEAKIIVTTLQKFPFIVEEVASLPDRTYAVIVDEAHSSQSGESAHEMKKALAGTQVEEEGDIEPADLVEAYAEAAARARGPHDNLSMFAFTATPKAKTLELFGRRGEDGNYEPFHVYSMRQAIEEGFIMDVLDHYTTYESYYRLGQAAAEDPEVEQRKAAKAIAKYVALHPTHLGQKAEVVIEHFVRSVAGRIGGKAKAMVVTHSRLAAVRFGLALREYANEHGYGDLGILVAFSGTVSDGGEEFTEPRMNSFAESQTVKRFATDEYRIIVVAEKFQTGFDQPLLHTMYVDKKLYGVNAVQTLSRLNRIHPGKEDTFILDFQNTADEIQESFAPYYDRPVAAPTDLNEATDAWTEVEKFGVVRSEDVEAFARVFFTPDRDDRGAQAKLYAALEPAKERFTDLEDDDAREEFRTALKRFVARYAHIGQILPAPNMALEKRFQYGRNLLKVVPRSEGATLDLGDQIELTHLRVKKTGDHRIGLGEGTGVVKLFGEGGPGGYLDEVVSLSDVIERVNHAHGLNLTEADKLHLEAVAADMVDRDDIKLRAHANTLENFGLEFEREFRDALVSRLGEAQKLTLDLLNNPEGLADLVERFQPKVYEEARVRYQKVCPIGELLARDEDQHLEFKSTLRWDLKEGAKSKLVESTTIKTVAAFLNSRYGGTLVIGVADDGKIVGLEKEFATLRKEGRDDADLFVLHLGQVIENAVGIAAASNVSAEVVSPNGDRVCRVHVEPSGHPVDATVTVKDVKGQFVKKEAFYIRFNNGTREITDENEREKYVAARWGRREDA